jgi:hypothetical protein
MPVARRRNADAPANRSSSAGVMAPRIDAMQTTPRGWLYLSRCLESRSSRKFFSCAAIVFSGPVSLKNTAPPRNGGQERTVTAASKYFDGDLERASRVGSRRTCATCRDDGEVWSVTAATIAGTPIGWALCAARQDVTLRSACVGWPHELRRAGFKSAVVSHSCLSEDL